MNSPGPALLQVALDVGDSQELLYIAQLVLDSVDWIEVGTPWILRDGTAPLRMLKDCFPNKVVLADMKIVDGGNYEAHLAFAAGADVVTVLACAGDATIRGVCSAAAEAGGKVVADLIQVADPAARAARLVDLGVDYVCAHTAFDDQKIGTNPLAALAQLAGQVSPPVMAAGGINRSNLEQILAFRPALVVVGSALTRAADPAALAAQLKAIILNSASLEHSQVEAV